MLNDSILQHMSKIPQKSPKVAFSSVNLQFESSAITKFSFRTLDER